MYHKTFYIWTKWPLKEWAAGCAVGPFVFIRQGYENDKGLLEHELCHVKQWWDNPIHSLQYLMSKKYRLNCEIEAYKVQNQCYPDDRRWLFAGFIADHYGLNVSQEEAFKLLMALIIADFCYET